MNEYNKQTIMAFIRLLCSVIASGAAMAGFALEADALFTGITLVLAIVAYIWSWWKNNNVTDAAKEAQELLEFIKGDGDVMYQETYDELSNGLEVGEDDEQ